MLLVGTFRRCRLANPFSRIMVRTYFPSGEMATCAAFPLSVILVTEKFSNGFVLLRRVSEYTPYPAAASTINTTRAIAPTPALFRFAAAITAEPEEGGGTTSAIL